ncbi:MAG: NosD domain-containing protein [Candidatus Woesearchaeota archaeon]
MGNTIIANSSGNTQVGIRLRDSHSSNISYNNISITGNSNNVCIELRNAENNSIENNTIINYGSGDNNHGMLLWDNSSNNSVVMDAIRASSTGNAIMMDHAGANVFIANWLRGGGNGYALWIEGSSFSSFYKTIINESTHFIYVNNTEHNNFTNTTFDNIIARVNFPWILQFNGTQNVSAGKLQLSPNRVFLNSTNLSFMNTTAIITLNEIAFIEPEPAVDYDDDGSYVPCPAEVCTELGYTDNIYVFNVTGFTSYKAMETAQINITSCPVVINSSAILKNDVSSSGSCITINASNAFLDCQGYLITYNSGGGNNNYGIGSFSNNNVTVRNCRINDSSTAGSNGYGIFFNATNSSIVLNSSIQSWGTFSNSPVWMHRSAYNRVENNTLLPRSIGGEVGLNLTSSLWINATGNTIITYTAGDTNLGVHVSASGWCRIANNSITTYGNFGDSGVQLLQTNYSTIANNIISTSGTASEGVYAQNAHNNSLSGNVVNAEGDGVSLYGSQQNLLDSNNITTSSSYSGINLAYSNLTNATNTQMNTTGHWINATESISNRFVNTTFGAAGGKINLPYNFTISGTYDINRARLLPTSTTAKINTVALPFLNTTGIISLYGIAASIPLLVVDYEDDGSYAQCGNVCTELAKSGSTYVFNVTHFTTFSAMETNITSCPVTINTSTILAGDLSSNTTCITIGASNVKLDCNGSTITFGINGAPYAAGVLVNQKNNVTISNCTIILGNASANYSTGINSTNTGNATMEYNTIRVNGTRYGIGISIEGDYDCANIRYNTIQAYGSSDNNKGIRIVLPDFNNVTGNIVSVNGTESNVALYIYSSHNDSVWSNSLNASGTGSDNNAMSLINTVMYGRIENNSISAFGDGGGNYGIYMVGIAQNNITGNAIRTSSPGTGNHGILIGVSANSNRFLLNNITTTGTTGFGIMAWDFSTNNIFNKTLLNTTAWIFIEDDATATFANTTFVRPAGSIVLNNFTLSGGYFSITESKLNISSNKAYLNSTNLTRLNTSGIVTLYGIGYADPTPIVDYEDDGSYANCPSSVCAELGYSGGAYTYNVSHFTSFSSSENITRITGCPATINESTELSQNISSNTSCITIGASNLELDCNGSTITYALQGGAGVNRGVFASYRRNVTIRDCTIILGNSSASNSYGIVLYRVNDSIVRNNTLLNNGTRNDDAILLDTYAFNNTIIENRITAGSNESDGINIKQLSENNTIQGNTINTLGTEENDGIYVYLSHGSRIYDNNITTNCTEINNHGIFIDYYSNYTAAGRNTIQRLGTGGGDYGIYLFAGSSNSNFSANTLVSHNALISDEAIVVQSGSNNNRFSFTNISSDVHSSYGAYIQQSAGLYFNNTLMNSTPYWIYLDSSSSANFTNTTFLTGSGSISLFAFNITAGAYVIANELSLNISSNRAYLNSTNLTRLNTSGIVTLYGIGYADPTPIVDYEDDGSYANCPSSVCAELGYSGGAYTYNVSHFTSYACVEGGMLGISKSDSPDPVSAESLLNYTIAVNVTGSIYNLTLTDQYPAQAIYQGSSPSPVAGTNNTWVLGNLTPGTNTSINISVRIRWVLNNTMINNTANVSFQNSTGTWNASVTEQTTVLNGRVIRSLIINSTIINCTIIDSTVINSTKQDCVIINSTVIDSLNINVTIIDSNETNSTDSNSFMKRSFAINLTKANSNLTDSNLTNSNVTNVTLDGCTVDNSTIFNVVNSSCTYYNYRQQQPPQPTPTQGGGGGNIGIPRWPAPEKAVGHLCVENWACEDWTRCIEGTQQRVCVELNGCNETRYEPVTERTCAMERVLREAPEKAEVPKVPVLPSERPEREAPAVVEKGLPAILLPLALDIALIMLAVLVIISLIVGSEKRSKKGLRAVIVLLMVAGIAALAWHYVAASQLLIMQAIALAVLSAAIMLVWIYDWRKSKKPGEIPEEEPVAPVVEEIQTPAVYVEPKPAKPMPEIPEPLPESPKPEWKPVPEARRKVILVEEEEPKPRKPEFLEPVRETVPEKKVVLVRKQKRAEPERVARLVRAEPLDLDAVLMRTGKTLKKVHKTLRRMKKKK